MSVKETLRVRHQSEHSAAFVLKTGDTLEAAVDVIGIDEGSTATFQIDCGFGGLLRDETTLGVGDGELKRLGQPRKIRARRSEILESHPLTLETATGILHKTP